MFGNNKPEAKKSSRSAGVETLIGRQTEIIGNLRFSGGLHLDGHVLGNVLASPSDATAHLSISNSGSVEGDVHVPSLVLNGQVFGNVHTSEKVSLGAKARVVGDVHYKLIEMHGGAQVNGKLVHVSAEPVVAETTPTPPAAAFAGADTSPIAVEKPPEGRIINGELRDRSYLAETPLLEPPAIVRTTSALK